MAKQAYPSPLPYPFSAAVRTGNLLYLSGQLGMREGKLGEGIEQQTRFLLENIRDVLATAGCSLEDVVKANVFMTDMSLWPRMNEVYKDLSRGPAGAHSRRRHRAPAAWRAARDRVRGGDQNLDPRTENRGSRGQGLCCRMAAP